MRRVPLITVIWTMALAIPLTALALVAAAYITDHLIEIVNAIPRLANQGRPWLLEAAARWPEVAGLIAGSAIIVVILLIARATNNHAHEVESN